MDSNCVEIFEFDFKLLVSFFSLGVSLLVLFTRLNADKISIFLSLRQRYLEIEKELPINFRNMEYANDEKLKQYWLHTFDEWYATNKIDRIYLRSLWTSYYRSAIKSALRHKSIRITLLEMSDSGLENSSFSGFKDEFLMDVFTLFPQEEKLRDQRDKLIMNIEKEMKHTRWYHFIKKLKWFVIKNKPGYFFN